MRHSSASLRACLGLLLAVAVSLAVQRLFIPHFYIMPWRIGPTAVRMMACMAGVMVVQLVLSRAKYIVVVGVVAFYLMIDLWSIHTFHYREPFDDTAAGWVDTPLYLKVIWLGIYSFSTALGSLLGQAVGSALLGSLKTRAQR